MRIAFSLLTLALAASLPAAASAPATVDAARARAEKAHTPVIRDFHDRHHLADVRVAINDNGATPATVSLRLDQAVAEFVAAARADSRA